MGEVLEWNAEGALNHVAAQIIGGFDGEIGSAFVEIAQKRAPVRSAPGTEAMALRSPSEFSGKDLDRLGELGTMNKRELAGAIRSSDLKFFRSVGRTAEARSRTPIGVTQKGGLRGVFMQEQGGTLKRSIRYDGTRRVGSKIIGTVRAHAPYAWFVHEGFTHVGGKEIAGRPFLKWAFANIAALLKSAASYKG